MGTVEFVVEVDDGWVKRNERRCRAKRHAYIPSLYGCFCGARTDEKDCQLATKAKLR